MIKYKRNDFPENFEFGTATSAYQIEGHDYGGAGRTHWDDFAATPDNVIGAEHGGIACDHYHRLPKIVLYCAMRALIAIAFPQAGRGYCQKARGR